MAIANYIKACAKNTPGIKPEFYVAPIGTITVLAETSGAISTLTAAANSFFRIQADLDSVQLTMEGAFSTSGAYTQNFIAKFAKPSTALNTLVDELVAQIACGVTLIWVDSNAKVWLAGNSVTSKEGSSRPFNQLATSLDTGLLPTDTGLNVDTLTFTRLSGVRPIELDSTLTAAVLAGTAAYIKWA